MKFLAVLIVVAVAACSTPLTTSCRPESVPTPVTMVITKKPVVDKPSVPVVVPSEKDTPEVY
jgi:hypothetical protein